MPQHLAGFATIIAEDYSIGSYDGNMQDALLTVHNSDLQQQGIVIGNEGAEVYKTYLRILARIHYLCWTNS